MNKSRRNQLEKIVGALNDLRDMIEQLQEDEQEAFDNLPEGLQQAERGQAMEMATDQMSTAVCSIEEAIAALEQAQA